MRVCFKCKIEKKLSEFYYRKDSNKYRNICKKCTKKRFKVNSKKHYVKNKLKLDEEHKQYYINNIEKLRVASKKVLSDQ